VLAIVAACVFGLALILDFADVRTGDALSATTLMFLGLLLLALHMAGVGSGWRRSRG
jgi:hypothetical protein